MQIISDLPDGTGKIIQQYFRFCNHHLVNKFSIY
jgi:hypothetical protein